MSIFGRIRGRRHGADPGADLGAVPRHIAIIMDGNGRWAKRRGLPRTAGHRVGLDRVEEIVRACTILGIKYLTLYAFSTENWRRAPEEVGFLMQLFSQALTDNTEKLHREGVRIRFIGRRDRLHADLLARVQEAEARTAANTTLTLALAVDYGARDEILQAVRRVADLARAGEFEPDSLDERSFSAFLQTAGMPDPDLIIRPSGEFRLSNFLLWQSAYAELWFTPVLWPDFGPDQLREALRAYAGRERRFGGVK